MLHHPSDSCNTRSRYHPMGFAYYADGAIRDKDELEPGIALGTDTSCADTKTCQAPQYFLNGKYLGGTYDNGIESGGGAPVGGDDFGLDEYEPRFARGRDDWIDEGSFSVKLKLTDTTYTKDLFYFCHIHGGMSGRIKVYDAQGNAVNQEGNTPALPYALEVPSAFDRSCGAYGIGTYNTTNSQCSQHLYVCHDTGTTADEVAHFGTCLEAVDCKMHVEMQTTNDAESAATTFMRQMIPHHENAVNMAKLLLKQEGAYGLACGDEEEDIDCDMVTAAWEMINGQNAQITLMRNWLTAKSKPRYAECSISPAPAGAGTSCKCSGKTHVGDGGPSCASIHEGKKYCYTNVGACEDGKASAQMNGVEFSFSACASATTRTGTGNDSVAIVIVFIVIAVLLLSALFYFNAVKTTGATGTTEESKQTGSTFSAV